METAQNESLRPVNQQGPDLPDVPCGHQSGPLKRLQPLKLFATVFLHRAATRLTSSALPKLAKLTSAGLTKPCSFSTHLDRSHEKCDKELWMARGGISLVHLSQNRALTSGSADWTNRGGIYRLLPEAVFGLAGLWSSTLR
ncbi:unnamed protein product [Bubo scandiacus]